MAATASMRADADRHQATEHIDTSGIAIAAAAVTDPRGKRHIRFGGGSFALGVEFPLNVITADIGTGEGLHRRGPRPWR